MDIGMIVIHLVGGRAIVSRCEDSPDGLRLIAALNVDDFMAEAAAALIEDSVELDADGIYLCPDQIQAEAQFPPLALPDDVMSYGEARAMLYPDVSVNAGWEQIHADVKARRLRVYRIGVGQSIRRYAVRQEVLALLQSRSQTGARV